jgi:hypothetical protein
VRTEPGDSVGKADDLMHGTDAQLRLARSHGHKPLSAAMLGVHRGPQHRSRGRENPQPRLMRFPIRSTLHPMRRRECVVLDPRQGRQVVAL